MEEKTGYKTNATNLDKKRNTTGSSDARATNDYQKVLNKDTQKLVDRMSPGASSSSKDE